MTSQVDNTWQKRMKTSMYLVTVTEEIPNRKLHFLCSSNVDKYGCLNVAKLSWNKNIFLRKKYVWF